LAGWRFLVAFTGENTFLGVSRIPKIQEMRVSASSPQDAGIRNFKDGISKDARLCREKGPGCEKKSPGAGSNNGGDLGAAMDAVEAALAGVE
jgi:hypothetical protein